MDINDKEYIKISDFSKSFDGKTILENINFTIKKGEFVCIIGSSGCGKSTLLKAISGLDPEHDGSIFINGEEKKKPSKNTGYIFQENRLFPWLSIVQNVCFSMDEGNKKEKKQKALEALKTVGLDSVSDQLPRTLSGGMAQRANIARSIVNNPEVLLLDEPFGALDAFTKIGLQEELCNIRSKNHTTMIMVTHDIEEAIFLADRIVVLGKNPGSIKKIIEVDLPRPRNRNDQHFNRLRKEVFGYFFEIQEIEEEYVI